MKDAWISDIAVALYNSFLIGGTAYVVFWLGHSGWWFLAAACFVSSSSVRAVE